MEFVVRNSIVRIFRAEDRGQRTEGRATGDLYNFNFFILYFLKQPFKSFPLSAWLAV
jgi:hypothetical protein